MHIVLLCATRRGYLFLQKLIELIPQSRLTVFSFHEEPWEPPFLDDIGELALGHGARFLVTKQVGDPRWASFWQTTPIDLMLVVSWRYLIPSRVYQRPRQKTYVFHDSLLPAYRGFAPTVWAIINGESHTSVSLFEISELVDSGDIVDQQKVPIGPDDPIAVVMEHVTQAYLTLLERNLHPLLDGTAPRRAQDHTRATYTCKRLPEDNRIDWTASSEQVYNLIRAVSRPYSGAYTYLAGKRLIVWSARRIDSMQYVGIVPGRVAGVRPGEGALVLADDGPLLLTEVQVEGGEVVCASEVLNSINLTLGRSNERV